MSRSDLFSEICKNAGKEYDRKQVLKCLIFLKKSSKTTTNPEFKQRLMGELFLLLSPIVLKQINNFKSLVKNYPDSKVLHTEDDIISECYQGLDRCVINLKWEGAKPNQFHHYFNSSLNKIIYRLYCNNYKKHDIVVENNEHNDYRIMKNSKYEQHLDLSEIDLKELDLTEIQMDILVMKTDGLDFQSLLKKHKISHIAYKEHLNGLKQKVVERYKFDQRWITKYLET